MALFVAYACVHAIALCAMAVHKAHNGRPLSISHDYVNPSEADADGRVTFTCKTPGCQAKRCTKVFTATLWSDHLALECRNLLPLEDKKRIAAAAPTKRIQAEFRLPEPSWKRVAEVPGQEAGASSTETCDERSSKRQS